VSSQECPEAGTNLAVGLKPTIARNSMETRGNKEEEEEEDEKRWKRKKKGAGGKRRETSPPTDLVFVTAQRHKLQQIVSVRHDCI
jgi:hypothetical protein